MLSKKAVLWLLVIVAVALIIIGWLVKPMPQSVLYHHFADQRTLFGITNAADVLSNLLFAAAGLCGLWLLFSYRKIAFINPYERWPWIVLSIGLILTALGSGYYHLSPNNARLVFDRIPIIIVFMSLFAAIINERISIHLGLWLWPFLLGIGIYSVILWYIGEIHGTGDLRLYFGIQIYAIIAIFLLLYTPAPYTQTWNLIIAIALYILAKICEALDHSIYLLSGNTMSGHTLKHIAAAIAGLFLMHMLWKRKKISKVKIK